MARMTLEEIGRRAYDYHIARQSLEQVEITVGLPVPNNRLRGICGEKEQELSAACRQYYMENGASAARPLASSQDVEASEC